MAGVKRLVVATVGVAMTLVANPAVGKPTAPPADAIRLEANGDTVRVLGTPGPDRVWMSVDCLLGWCLVNLVDFSGQQRLEFGPGCYRLTGGEEEVRCNLDRVRKVVIRLGGGDDRYFAQEFHEDARPKVIRVHGGPGDDWLKGGHMNERWLGGPGDDRITVDGQSRGIDTLNGPDDVFGGPGYDTVDYSRSIGAAATGVRVTPNGRADDGTGAAKDVDNVRGDVEAIVGSAGDDLIRTTNRRQEEVSCGAGTDRVVADARDQVARPPGDCEFVTTIRLSARAEWARAEWTRAE